MPSEQNHGLMWFRSDLRLCDNKALYHAAKNHPDGLLAIFCCCDEQWQEHDWGNAKVCFILRQLECLSVDCADLNISLKIVRSKTFTQSAKDVVAYAKKNGISNVYYNKEVEINERNRDKGFVEMCKEKGLTYHAYQDSCILAPGSLRNLQGGVYSVFTPFKKKWLTQIQDLDIKVLPKPKKRTKQVVESSPIPKRVGVYKIGETKWSVGEGHAQKHLKQFLNKRIDAYDTDRDIPSVDGTSSLSPYLANGLISARTCYLSSLKSSSPGAETWRSELIWREFYRHLLYDVPRLSKGFPFKLATQNIEWSTNEADFQKWCDGETGIPLIDAAMRQLKETNWMHNRLRMVVAMFLTKNLRIHWSWGEKHFSKYLIDLDLAANNGGWQWSASTGCDAVPYFRVFNPISQSKKFDPKGLFIKTYCPELKQLSSSDCHEPHAQGKNLFALDYPEPMVDLKASRLKAIEMFKNLK